MVTYWTDLVRTNLYSYGKRCKISTKNRNRNATERSEWELTAVAVCEEIMNTQELQVIRCCIDIFRGSSSVIKTYIYLSYLFTVRLMSQRVPANILRGKLTKQFLSHYLSQRPLIKTPTEV